MKKAIALFLIMLGIFLVSFRFDWEKVKRTFFEQPLLEEGLEGFTSFEIKNEFGENRFSKIGKSVWLLNDSWHADKRIIFQLRKLLHDTRIEREVLYETGDQLSRYGLENPWSELKLFFPDKQLSVKFGDRSPIGINYYALASWLPSKVLLLNYSRLYEMLHEDSFQWEDRRLIYKADNLKKASITLHDYDEILTIDFLADTVVCQLGLEKPRNLAVTQDELLQLVSRLKYSYQIFGDHRHLNLDYPNMSISIFDDEDKLARQIDISSAERDLYCLMTGIDRNAKTFILEQLPGNIIQILHGICQR